MKKNMLILGLLCLLTTPSKAQWAIKTNAAYLVTTTLNLGTEIGLGERTSLDLVGMYNPFTFADNRKIKLWAVQPELRYWLCETFDGHFFGLHGHYAEYNAALKTFRHEGWLAGAGISYGYQFLIGERWNLELELGVGYAYMDYDRYLRTRCGKFIDHKTRNYYGPTKLSVSFMYVFR